MFSLPLVVVAHHLRWVDPLDPLKSSKPLPFSNYKKMRKNKLSRLNAFAQAFGAILESQISKAELCITISEAVAENLRALGISKQKIAVTGNAVDCDYIESFQNYEKRYDAVFVGRLDMGKGIGDLIKVWKQVIEILPNAELVVIGSGFLRETSIKLTKELGLESKIKFMGSVTDKKLYRTLDASKLFVLPSRMEGWSIATAEALAKGLPAVCYDIPPIREIFGASKSVFLVPTGDIKAFAKQIIYLLSLEQTDYEVLKQISQHYSRRFDWHNIALKEHQALVKVTQS
jgi:glycosyltransferase involved in cell wall biosynthesis